MRSQIHLIYSTGNSLNDIHNKQQLYKTTKPPNAICFFNSNVNLKLITPTPISRSTVHQYNNSWAGIVVPKLINSSPLLIIHYFISIIHYVSISFYSSQILQIPRKLCSLDLDMKLYVNKIPNYCTPRISSLPMLNYMLDNNLIIARSIYSSLNQ